MPSIEVAFNLSDKVKIRGSDDEKGMVVCILVAWSGNAYKIIRFPDGEIIQYAEEELEHDPPRQ